MSVFSPEQHAWCELILKHKYTRPMIKVAGPMGTVSHEPGGLPKITEVLDAYPMPAGWQIGDGLPAGY